MRLDEPRMGLSMDSGLPSLTLCSILQGGALYVVRCALYVVRCALCVVRFPT